MLTFRLLLLTIVLMVPTAGLGTELFYNLDVSIDPSRPRISGQASLTSLHGKVISLSTSGLSNIVVTPGRIVDQTNNTLKIKLSKGHQTDISYHVDITSGHNAFIDHDHVYLMDRWYPQPTTLAEYRLTVNLPQDFIAISEAETINRQATDDGVEYRFQFHHPLDTLHLAASNRFVVQRDYHQGIEIETYLFTEDADLAPRYLEHAAKYLEKYQGQLTPFPYRRFAIVENILPTGISMPTFTLLGKDVIRLPFIVTTSLAHEIIHQWFGNSIYIDPSQGNWAEGLATYLADHAVAKDKGRDSNYRKKIMVDYEAHVHPGNIIPLSEFQYRRNKAEGVIGYGQAAMFFHELENRLGLAQFREALQDFVYQHLYRRASWQDLRNSFEKISNTSLEKTTQAWLERTTIPKLDVVKSRLVVNQGKLHLSFEIRREENPIPLTLPIHIYTENIRTVTSILSSKSEELFELPLASLPSRVVLDEQYHVMRQLTQAETPPVLAQLLGSREIVAVVAQEDRPLYQALIDALHIPTLTYLDPDAIEPTRLADHDVLIAGSDNNLTQIMLGRLERSDAGIHLRVFKNPIEKNRRIFLVDISDINELHAVQKKLRHYGKYSEVAFSQGINTYKKLAASYDGIELYTYTSPSALIPNQIPSLDTIIPKLFEKQIIYIGEQHNRFEHHINQLHIIQSFNQKGIDIAVGMEMFKQPYQGVIDAYLADQIDEHTFLKHVRYYQEWGFDYNLYKPIIDYIKAHHIPLVALNLAGKITKKVARSGIQSLEPEELSQIPTELDFSDQRYVDDLREVYALHAEQQDLDNFQNFLQAQVLWDETMAEAVYQYLRINPGKKMIVLAGNGHLRNRYGIPDRVQRRGDTSFAVVLQDDTFEAGIADYVLKTSPMEGTRSLKLGVGVGETEQGLQIKNVVPKSPAQKAGLQKDDIILSFNHHPVEYLADLRWGLYNTQANVTYPMEIKRDDTTIEKAIELFDFSNLMRHGSR